MGDGEPRTASPDREADAFSVSADRYSMSTGIRNLIIAWGAGPDQRDDEERLEADLGRERVSPVPSYGTFTTIASQSGQY